VCTRGRTKKSIVGIVERNDEVKAQNIDKNKLNFSGLLELVRRNVNMVFILILIQRYNQKENESIFETLLINFVR
jgi:hypothetical protein